jgi:ATP-binding protein involved in chromosome partitioning
VQKAPLTGAVIVTTPQHLALVDAERACEMFRKVHVPLLGIVENMTMHHCSHCGHTEAIFGRGAGETLAKKYDIPLLGNLPLAARIGSETDRGTPSIVADPHSRYAKDFHMIATTLQAHVAQLAASAQDFPEIVIKND